MGDVSWCLVVLFFAWPWLVLVFKDDALCIDCGEGTVEWFIERPWWCEIGL